MFDEDDYSYVKEWRKKPTMYPSDREDILMF